MRSTARARRLAGLSVLALASSACSTFLGPLPQKEARPLALRSQIRASDGTLLATLFEENRVQLRIANLHNGPLTLAEARLAARVDAIIAELRPDTFAYRPCAATRVAYDRRR